jgi:benzoyl-CoA reductase/2-hydroxyglutaryl-CoA dehydratase subunit BcrC/BadD/HgdB
MSGSDTQFRYPEEIGQAFIETGGLDFSDGRHVSAAEIWHFMTKEAPVRFPHAFDTSIYFRGISSDVNLFSGIKRNYLSLTLKDRLQDAHKKGVPAVFIQGGQTVEPYYAAGGIPVRPGVVSGWARNQVEGLSTRQSNQRGLSILETGRRAITIDSCGQIAAHAALAENLVPIDLVAPYLCLRCSDMAYLVESHRQEKNNKRNTPLHLVDFPVGQQGEWRKEYLAKELKNLTDRISKISKKEVTDEILREEIKRENKARKLLREIYELRWSAKVPPTNSVDHSSVISIGVDGCGDFTAATDVLEETRNEIKERVKHGIKGHGIDDDPVRLWTCGSCVGPRANRVDESGGVIVGKDDWWSEISTDVEETGDPYENLAEAILSFPYELPTEERAEWTAEQVKKSRADGAIFYFAWGCNYQSGVARMIADIIKERTGVPTINIEAELTSAEGREQEHNRIESFIEMLN